MTAPGERYTHGHHESVLRSHRWRTAENSAAYLLPHLRPGLDLLDVGCGPGTITLDLARARRAGPGRSASTRNADVLRAATADAADAGLTNVTFEVGDAYALAFDDDRFDVVHAHQVLQHLADPVAALAEMARVRRPAGIVAARDMRLRVDRLVPAMRRRSTAGWSCTARRPVERRRARRPAGGSSRGRRGRLHGRDGVGERRGASRAPRTGRGGAGSGRTG